MPIKTGHQFIKPEDKKTESIRIRITKKEKDLIKAFCELNRIDMSEFLRAIVMDKLSTK